MRDILSEVSTWRVPFALAMVIGTSSSAPRGVGAAMAIDSVGRVVGSVSGGCVEGDLYARCQEVLETRQPQLATYGISDDDAFTIGLTCGGQVQVFIRCVDPATGSLRLISTRVRSGIPTALATIVNGVHSGGQLVIGDRLIAGSTGKRQLDEAIVRGSQGILEQGTSRTFRVGEEGQRRHEDITVFVESYTPPPRMLIFGSTDFAAALSRVGKFLGYRVTVCDARPVFTTPSRFPDADEVVVRWPHQYLADTVIDARTVICVLTHDPKFDVPIIEEALRTPAAFIGVMGSRRTHQDRNSRLRDHGFSESELSRLASPVGLDLGARTPEETAVSIAAEIIARRWGGSGFPLAVLDGPIHHVHSRRPHLTAQQADQEQQLTAVNPASSYIVSQQHAELPIQA
ncbi:XdhC family protein [Paenarthrobacter sp. NPDC091669]|uniref:XdhC family protein n=1 Tax=Paenarthrobacter sp. NPDC091669 TaxID=3364384 RepID=UPI00381B79DA